MKQSIEFDTFLAVDLRVGTIITCVVNEKARHPAYILTVDFGREIGIKTSSAQLTQNYTPEDLIGSQIVAVLNFPVKRIAGVASEILILGAIASDQGVVLLRPTVPVQDGSPIG